APDRAEASVVEGVVRKIVGPDVLPHPGFGPIRDRVELEKPERLVPFESADGRPRDRLLPPQARHPELQAVKCPSQRRDLADLATLPSVGAARAERERTLLEQETLDAVAIREVRLDRNPVPLTEAADDLVRLLGEPARVEREDPRVGAGLEEHVGDHDVLRS